MIDNKKNTLPPDADVICTLHTGTKNENVFDRISRSLTSCDANSLGFNYTMCAYNVIVTHDEPLCGLIKI